MVLYGITLILLAEELRAEEPVILSLLYAENVEFNELAFFNTMSTVLYAVRIRVRVRIRIMS